MRGAKSDTAGQSRAVTPRGRCSYYVLTGPDGLSFIVDLIDVRLAERLIDYQSVAPSEWSQLDVRNLAQD